MTPQIFISHTRLDFEIVGPLVNLLKAALVIPQQDIRCTSLPGYGLPGGVRTTDHLRDEVLSCEFLIGLISKQSFASAWVLFELGARWASKKRMVPLLGPGVPRSILKGPISELNPLSFDVRADVEQLVEDARSTLGCEVNRSSHYSDEIEALLQLQGNFARREKPDTVLGFFLQHPGEAFYPSAVASGVGISRKDAITAIEQLVVDGYATRRIEKYGPTFGLNPNGPRSPG